MGDYEDCSWQGWHRHATLIMLAQFFVVQENAAAPKKRPGLTVPQTCLLVDAMLPRTGSPADRTLVRVQTRVQPPSVCVNQEVQIGAVAVPEP